MKLRSRPTSRAALRPTSAARTSAARTTAGPTAGGTSASPGGTSAAAGGTFRHAIGVTAVAAAVVVAVGAAALLPAPPAGAAGAGPDAYTVRGIDSYHGDHGPEEKQAFDWPAIARSGQSFVMLKATQGTGFTDGWFARDLAGARSVDLIRTGYHYFTADEDGSAQADHFLDVLHHEGFTGTKPGELPPVLDLEQCEKAGHRLQLGQVKAFLQQVRKVTGAAPIIYTRKGFVDDCLGGTKELSRYPVWLARYGDTPPRPLPGATGWDFWQYTDHASVPGTPGNVDASVFHADRAALRHLAHLG
ncbi:glycoside hydrolase family 25 protein [Kitasatospora sp. NBC_00039]|uniref:glycoside hydrolase family 25 protein n=1 Tax=Kitasatospora sp. NBC_00039 TaxID=2903565 RepID=UPI0032540735